MFQMDELEHFLHACIDLGFRLAGDFEAKGDIFVDVHVGEQRIGLKHHADIALVRSERRLVLAVDDDRSAGRDFETGDHAQHGGLAAARWSEKGDELALSMAMLKSWTTCTEPKDFLILLSVKSS